MPSLSPTVLTAENDILNGGVGNDQLFGDTEFYYSPYSPDGYPVASPASITGGTDTLNGGAGNDPSFGWPNFKRIAVNFHQHSVVNGAGPADYGLRLIEVVFQEPALGTVSGIGIASRRRPVAREMQSRTASSLLMLSRSVV